MSGNRDVQAIFRPLLFLALTLLTVLLVATFLYMQGMRAFEGEPRSFWRALEWAAETLTSTGYGGDADWNHPIMVLFVVALQFLGVFLIFLFVPAYLVPVLERRFVTRLPTRVRDMQDHVIVYRWGPAVTSLIEELTRAGKRTLIVEEDEGQARSLYEKGFDVLAGTLDDRVLERSCLPAAAAIIANGSDDENTALILAARQLGFNGEILALVEEPAHRHPMILAGASGAFTPRHVLGAALAARASDKLSPRAAGAQLLGDRLEVREVRLRPRSGLAGKTLAEADLARRTGVHALGQWVGGRLQSFKSPEDVLAPNAVLIVVGSDDGIRQFEELTEGATTLRREGPIVIAGFGEVGSKVAQLFRDVGEEVRVVDVVEREDVDVVGDILDLGVIEEAGLAVARSVILAMDKDSSILFATVILKDLYPDLPVIARVNRAINVERIHQAGAEFALSVSQVSGQLLARRLLGDETYALDEQVRIVRSRAEGLAGLTPRDAGIRERTGCSVVAVERGDEVILDFGGDFRFREDDVIFVSGDRKATRRFSELFPAA